MWGKIMIPMYELWSHGFYGLHWPRCPLSKKGVIYLTSHLLTTIVKARTSKTHVQYSIVKVGINHTIARSGVCNRYVTFQIVGNSRISSLFDRFIPLHITIKNKSQEIEVVDFLYLNTIYLNSMDMRTDTFPYWMKDHVFRFGHIK